MDQVKANNFDLLIVGVFIIGGSLFFWDVAYWAGLVNMGNSQYGDAAFWWNGALHFAKGIIKDNPNLDYRMGYAIFSGLYIAVFGGSFLVFHKFLVFVFLFSASTLYFSLKPSLGRIAAAGATALLIFNPFSAEWLAISTSDSVGLILNILALSYLIHGSRSGLHFGFLSAFGFLLACASLTRPLMSPFIALAVVILLLRGVAPWRRRFQGVGIVLTAFAVPTLLWVIALHSVTGSWAMAGTDSSTFYAGSDPKIQVWNGAMHEKVLESARSRYQTKNVSQAQLDKEFWILAKENYASHFDFHLLRVVPHTLALAGFSNRDMAKNTLRWDLIRQGILTATMIGLVLLSAVQRRWLGALLAGVLGSILVMLPASQSLPETQTLPIVRDVLEAQTQLTTQFFPILQRLFAIPALPTIQAVVCLIATVLFALSAFCTKRGGAYAAIALYWWTGVTVLYFVGGTWGPPLGAVHGMNALGYRLGSQFFFINDLAVVAFLGLVATLKFPFSMQSSRSTAIERWLHSVLTAKIAPNLDIRALFYFGTMAFVSFVVISGMVGGAVIGCRVWHRNHDAPLPFPPVAEIQSWWQENTGLLRVEKPLKTVLNIAALSDEIGSTGAGGVASPYVLFTGGMSDFVWNFDGQSRSQSMIYLQDNVSPFRMSSNVYIPDDKGQVQRFASLVYVEFPTHLDDSQWAGKQGAWVVRRLVDLPSKSNLPFYFTETAVKAFIPLSAEKKGYDFSAARIFPLQKYASQLYATGDLKVLSGVLGWDYTSGAEKYSRRFSVALDKKIDHSEPIVIELDTSKAIGARALSFKWSLERAVDGTQSAASMATLTVLPSGQAGQGGGYYFGDVAPVAVPPMLKSVGINLIQPKDNKVKFVLNGVMPTDKVWFYEFNVQADEFLN